MKFIKPLVVDDETFDYNLYVIAGDNDTPFNRTLVTLLILFINLLIGCAFTIAFFKIRVYFIKVVNLIFCGLCEDCDCDYEGNYSSRSASVKYHKIRSNQQRRQSGNYNDDDKNTDGDGEEYFDCKETLSAIWNICKSSRGKRVLILLLGVGSGIVAANQLRSDGNEEPVTLVHSFSPYAAILEIPPARPRIYFITPTIKSGIQPARLIRIAQAIFPFRDTLTWVIVSADPVQSYHWSGTRTEHWSLAQISKWTKNETRVLEHLEDVRNIVHRFGIPYVILSGHKIHHKDKGFKVLTTDEQVTAKARQIGLTWVTKTFSKGVLLMGHEDGAYNSYLFSEILKTRNISMWSRYSQSRYVIGLSTPAFSAEDGSGRPGILGYFRGGRYLKGTIPLYIENYALNISIARKLRKANQLWKLSMNNEYTLNDLDLGLNDVQCLGRNCSENKLVNPHFRFTFGSCPTASPTSTTSREEEYP